MRKQSLVCDTSLLLYLGRIENEDLLQVLFEKVYVTEQVVLELDAISEFTEKTHSIHQQDMKRIFS